MKRILLGIITVVVGAVVGTAVATPAYAVNAAFVHLQVRHGSGGGCLNTHGSAVSNAAVYADSCLSADLPYWHIQELGDGYHKIELMRLGAGTNLCLTAPAWSNYYAVLYSCSNPTGEPHWDQQWRIWGDSSSIPMSAFLWTRSAEKCLTGPTWSGRRALAYDCTYLADQYWRLWG